MANKIAKWMEIKTALPYKKLSIPTSFNDKYIFFSPLGIKEIITDSLNEAQRMALSLEEEAKTFLLNEWVINNNVKQ